MRMRNPFAGQVPHAPQWLHAGRPAWFRESAGPEEAANSVTSGAEDDAIPEMSFAEAGEQNVPADSSPWDSTPAEVKPAASQTKPEPKARGDETRASRPAARQSKRRRAAADTQSARPATTPTGFRYREALIGGAVASLLFFAFSFGFLSRGMLLEPGGPAQVAVANPESLPANEHAAPAATSSRESQIEVPSDEVSSDALPKPPTVLASTDRSEKPKTEPPATGHEPAMAVAAVSAPAQKPASPPVAARTLPVSLTGLHAKPAAASASDMIPARLIGDPLGLQTAAADGAACENGQCSTPDGPVGRTIGTAVAFADSPAEARAKARDMDRLVMIMHVSGNFENPGFT